MSSVRKAISIVLLLVPKPHDLHDLFTHTILFVTSRNAETSSITQQGLQSKWSKPVRTLYLSWSANECGLWWPFQWRIICRETCSSYIIIKVDNLDNMSPCGTELRQPREHTVQSPCCRDDLNELGPHTLTHSYIQTLICSDHGCDAD